jgi:hypothetical protein
MWFKPGDSVVVTAEAMDWYYPEVCLGINTIKEIVKGNEVEGQRVHFTDHGYYCGLKHIRHLTPLERVMV